VEEFFLASFFSAPQAVVALSDVRFIGGPGLGMGYIVPITVPGEVVFPIAGDSSRIAVAGFGADHYSQRPPPMA